MPQAKPAGTPPAEKIMRCSSPGCHLAGPEVGRCGNANGPIPCGVPVVVKPATDVVIQCVPCDKTWAVSVPNGILKRGQSMPRCCGSTDRCRATVVKPA